MNKNKDVEAAAHFHTEAAKIAQVTVLRTFMLENKFVISVLFDMHSIFICLITGFRAIDHPSPPCANTPLSYIVQNVNTHTGKSFCWHNGGMMRYKTSPNFYIFHFLQWVPAQN